MRMRVLASSMMLWVVVVIISFAAAPAVGLVVGTVIGFGILFGIFNVVQDILIARGRIASRVGTGFDVLLALGIIVVAVKSIVGIFVHERMLHSGAWDYLLLVLLAALLLLGRVLALLKAVRGHDAQAQAAATDEN